MSLEEVRWDIDDKIRLTSSLVLSLLTVSLIFTGLCADALHLTHSQPRTTVSSTSAWQTIWSAEYNTGIVLVGHVQRCFHPAPRSDVLSTTQLCPTGKNSTTLPYKQWPCEHPVKPNSQWPAGEIVYFRAWVHTSFFDQRIQLFFASETNSEVKIVALLA